MYTYTHTCVYIYICIIYIYMYIFQATGSCADPSFLLVQLVVCNTSWPSRNKRSVEGVLESPPWVPVGAHFFQEAIIFEVSEGSCGLLGGLFGVQGVRGSPLRDREAPVMFLGGSWRGPGKPSFSLLRCEFVNCLMKY